MTTQDTTLCTSPWLNLADARLGTEVIYANDDFFAEKENLINSGRGIFIADKYTERGKWMDGWESRRKREPGNDWCIVKLGAPGMIHQVDIDTNHFLGNHPPHASIEICDQQTPPDANTIWQELLPKSPLKAGSQNFFDVPLAKSATYVRLQIFPDGGVARLRIYGKPRFSPKSTQHGLVDLAAGLNGARVIGCNDMFFSSKDNLIMPERGVNMGDGWETRRRRTPGNDWCVIEAATRGLVQKIEIDTAHFKGNFPDRFTLWGCDRPESDPMHLEESAWTEILGETKLAADQLLHVDQGIADVGPITHLRLNIIPDGGVSRLRCWGTAL
jgi:allantoicase